MFGEQKIDLNFDPSQIFEKQLTGMNLTVFDSKVKDKIFQNLQNPKKLHFTQLIHI